MPHDRPAAGHRVRLALVGFGYWGPNYARVLNDLPDAELTAVCDRSADRLSLVRQRYRAVATCASEAELFARSLAEEPPYNSYGGMGVKADG